MKIAIQASDLDAKRVDGTRVYILNLLKYFGALDKNSNFFIYHKNKFNPELTPPNFTNYHFFQMRFPFFWTQIRFCWAINKKNPDVLWMPMHNIPIFKKKRIKTVVTIHDLAFKYFPEMFTWKERWKLNLLARLAIKRSDGIITISEASKQDILKFYPQIKAEKIKVIYHGFDKGVFSQRRDLNKEQKIRNKFKIQENYLLYIGAIQPRKNLLVLIKAFEKIKADEKNKKLQLVLAGEKAWLWKPVWEKVKNSPYKKDIIMPGKINFADIGHLMRGATIFIYPSLYEGFGLPILEAMASQVPVICAQNSSLPEVAGEAALFFVADKASDLATKIRSLLTNNELRKKLIEKGKLRVEEFSWQKCAQETLGYIEELKI